MGCQELVASCAEAKERSRCGNEGCVRMTMFAMICLRLHPFSLPAESHTFATPPSLTRLILCCLQAPAITMAGSSSSGGADGPGEQMERLVSRLMELTCHTTAGGADGESGYTEFGNNTSQPNSLSASDDVDAIRVSLSCLVIGRVRECYISPDCLVADEDVILIERFIVRHMISMIDSSFESDGGIGLQNLEWLQSMLQEVTKMLQASFFLLSKIKHSLLIPLLHVYDHLITSIATVPSLTSNATTIDDNSLNPAEDRTGHRCKWKRRSDLKQVMRDLLILLFSYSVSPHEVQLFFDLHARHSSATSSSRAGSGSGSPVKSISGSVKDQCAADNKSKETTTGETDDDLRDDYFVLMSKSLSDPSSFMSGMVRNFFSFTSYSGLSLPPVKSFPIKGFSFATSIRLESVVLLQKSALVKDYRMFLFSFKTSSSPPIGFSAYFSFPNASTRSAASDDDLAPSSPSYLKLTVSCFKGSLSPSLTHTLNFPFPLMSGGSSCGSNSTSSSQFIPLVMTFSSTCLSLYLAGELIECNSNDWSISNMKSAVPSFDRCFIGCPFSPQSKGSISNPNDSGFTGQLASIYIFSAPLSGTAVSVFSSLRDPSNAASCFILSHANDSAVTSNGSGNSASAASSNASALMKVKEREKFVKEINSSLVCLYSPSSVNWPIVLQNVNASCTSLSVASTSATSSLHHHHHHHHSGSSTAGAAASAGGAAGPSSLIPALTSHSLIQGNLEVVQRNLLIDSMQSLDQGIDMMTRLLISFIREKRFSQFSQLLSFSLDLIASDVNHFFLESAVGTCFFRQILTAINSLSSGEDRARFLSLPSLFLPSLLSMLQSMMTPDRSNSATTNTGVMLQPFMEGKDIEIREMEAEKVRKMRLDCIKQILELFIFNSFLWFQLIPSISPDSAASYDGSDEASEARMREDDGTWKRREETLSSLYSFISTQLLSFPSSVHLLKKKRRAAFLLQVFHSLKSHFYHKKWDPCVTRRQSSSSDQDVKSDVNEIPDSNHEAASRRKLFDRRERIVSVIRSNILVFIKNLLTKTSSLCLTSSSGSSNNFNNKNSPSGSSSGSSTATAGTTVELLDAGSSSDNPSESGKMNDKSSGSSTSRMQDHHLMESMSASTLIDDSDESSFFEEETNCLLNYLSILSREVLQRENPEQKSLLNVIDVLSLMNSVLIEIPCSMIPSFDSRKGIQVLFQVMNNTIRSAYDADPGEVEEKEVIRSLCLKILGSFLMRSTFKRKSLSMTSSHFSILYYMLSRDRSILTHSLYVNLMEITIEAPISSLYSLQTAAGSASGQKKGSSSGKNDPAEDDYYWSSSVDATDRENERASSACSSGKENEGGSSCGSTIKIENPQMIKVIAMLVVKDKVLADQFLKDLFTLLMDSRSNRRLILQMSVWQSWLISFLRMQDADYDDRERRRREVTVVSLFKLLLYHALRWEFGGWRVWIDSLAIIHSFLSRESFNKMYSNFDTQDQLIRNSSGSTASSRSSTTATDQGNANAAADGEEDEKPEDERSSTSSLSRETPNPTRSTEAASSCNTVSTGGGTITKRRLPIPTYRIPAFKWSAIHVQLLDSLLSSIIMDINSFRKEALMRANLNASPTAGINDLRSESDTNESLILETLLMSSDIYVINIIHLISQLTDSTILDAGGLLPLLALATSSSSAASVANANANANTDHSTAVAGSSKRSPDVGNVLDDDLMSEGRATELLHQLVFCADHLIFNTSLSSSTSSQVTSSGSGGSSSNSISLAELEAEKNMSSGGLLRQILRLVSMVSVKRVLSIKEKVKRSRKAGVTEGETGKENGKSSDVKEDEAAGKAADPPESSSDASDADSDDEINTMTDPRVTSGPAASASAAKRKFLSRYTIIDREEESDQLLLSVRDIHRLRATLYRSDPSLEKDRANCNFLALSTMYFLSVLLVSKYRDTLDVVQTAVQNTSSKARSSESGSRSSGSSDKTADLSLMEKSLFPTVQFLKEIITDFESFLSKSLLGSKGQVLLTKQLVKRIKSNECSPLELVMLLCAQEFQNSLQKNAGLAFIELINEGRLLSISMKEHVIRVGIEADFILSRIEREERDRDTLFKRESYLIEEKREKEADLVQEVICNICCPADVSLTGPSFTLSVPCSASSFRSKLRGSKRKSFRDLEEFVSEKKIVLFKEDFLMQEREASASSSSSTASARMSASASAIPMQRQQSASGTGIESVIHQTTAVVTSSASTSDHMKDEEILILRDRVKELLSRICVVEKERDHAVLQLQVYKSLMQQTAKDDQVASIGQHEGSKKQAAADSSNADMSSLSEETGNESEGKEDSEDAADPGEPLCEKAEPVIANCSTLEKEATVTEALEAKADDIAIDAQETAVKTDEEVGAATGKSSEVLQVN